MYRTLQAVRLSADGAAPVTCTVAEEVPVGLEYNGIPHVVLMATPADLGDLAIGFSLTDGICRPDEIEAQTERRDGAAFIVDQRLSPAALARFLQQRQSRVRRSYTSCGVCGIDSVASLPHTPPTSAAPVRIAAIRRALDALRDHQPLTRLTGAAHAAAWAAPDGEILLAREDVGRHNALDKLIGAQARQSSGAPHGFCLVTSRCSYEMVQKAAAAGFGVLACISAPTGLAIDEATKAGLTLVALARADTQTVYAGAARVVI